MPRLLQFIRTVKQKEPHPSKGRGSLFIQLLNYKDLHSYISNFISFTSNLHQIETIQPLRNSTYLYRLNKNNDPSMIGAPI